ncbi:MAG: transporter [Candidatus Omnitrophica bacterium]|nr:transporter [Candidatus Omnitrophota bacterium]
MTVLFLQFFIAFLLIGLSSTQAFAVGSGAYRIEVPDAGAMGMGSAFVGDASSPAAVYYNPAGMTQIVKSSVSIGASLIQPKMDHTSTTGAKTKEDRDSFVIPNLFYVTHLGMEKVVFGVGATSSWGLGTEWAGDSFARYSSTKTLLQDKDYLITAAYKMSEQVSLALGVVIDDSSIEKQRKLDQALFGGSGDANAKLKGTDTAPGFLISGMYKLNDQHQFGLTYRSAIHHKYTGKLHLDNLDTAAANFAFGSDFASSSYETNISSKSTIPQALALGYSYKPTEKLKINADIEWTDWSSTKHEAVNYTSETNTGKLTFLNLGNPANRDWHSAWALSLGGEYKVDDRLRLRSGYFYHQSPIPEATWDTCLPDANSHSIAAGFGYDITKALTFDLAYSAMFFDAHSIKNNSDANHPGSLDGKYEQWVNLVLATATYSF